MPRSFAVAVVLLSPLPLLAQPKPAPPAVPGTYPTLTTPANLGVRPGQAAELTLTGTNLTDATGVWTSFPAKATIPTGQKDAAKLKVKLDVPADAKPGLYMLRVATKAGVSNLRPICVDPLPQVAEAGKNKSKNTPQTLPGACVITGAAEKEAADYFKFPVEAGRPVTVEVLGRRIGSPIDPVVILYDATGRELGGVYADDTPGLQSDARVIYTPKQTGELIAEVRDTTYRGGAEYVYRLRIGHFPGATTAFPLAVQRGKSVEVGFSGPDLNGVKPVKVVALTDPTEPVVYIAPKRAGGVAGWPVPVRLSDDPQSTEQEPNNESKQANKLPVPGGVSARFGEKNDVDHFRFAAKKGAKYTIAALTYQVNAPTEIYIRLLDAKGKELAKSNPQQATAQIAFTAPADGDYLIACEHLNYLAGPNEVYHLSVVPVAPDFAVTVGLDRIDVPAGGIGLLPITGITKLNGFAAPIEFSVTGAEELTGSLTLPAGANPTPTAPVYVVVKRKAGAKAPLGPRAIYLKATAKIAGKPVVRFGSDVEIVKAALSGLRNPPPEFADQLAVALTPAPPFTLTVKFDKPEVPQGGTLKGTVTARRAGKFAEAITLASVDTPANATLKLKPIAKAANEAAFELVTTAKTAVRAEELILRGTAKVNGKDVSVAAPPAAFRVTPPAKKKDEKKPETKPKKKK
jgi:hypothetical protein